MQLNDARLFRQQAKQCALGQQLPQQAPTRVAPVTSCVEIKVRGNFANGLRIIQLAAYRGVLSTGVLVLDGVVGVAVDVAGAGFTTLSFKVVFLRSG